MMAVLGFVADLER
jgi:hypothetical protein